MQNITPAIDKGITFKKINVLMKPIINVGTEDEIENNKRRLKDMMDIIWKYIPSLTNGFPTEAEISELWRKVRSMSYRTVSFFLHMCSAQNEFWFW